jgi:hypothetical protein
MRLLPCRKCGGPAKTSGGEAYLIGGVPPRFPFVYQCGNCKSVNTLRVAEFNGLPLLGPAE